MLDYYPITKPIRTTEPTFEQEPISLDEARAQCGLTGNKFHDEDLRRFISSAREQFENDTGIICYTGSFTWKLTEWPYCSYLEIRSIRPVTAITSITYVDGSGVTQTWGSSNYVAPVLHEAVPAIKLAYSASWPGDFRGDINGITITLVAGYATVSAIPKRVKDSVLLAMHTLWLHKMEDSAEAERQQTAYNRMIFPGRNTYP